MKKWQRENRVQEYLRADDPTVAAATIELMEEVCRRTGRFDSFGAVLHTLDQWGRITSSAVAAYKLVQGIRCPFWAKVHYEEYAWALPIDSPAGVSRAWLDDCAKAEALRRAFPQQVWGLYLSEEIRLGPGFSPGV